MRNQHIIFVVVTVLVMSCISIAAPDRNSEAYDQYHTLSRIVSEINRSYVGKVDREKLFEGAYQGMLQSLDPHSAFMPPEEKEAFDNEAAGEFCGLGIEITADKNGILQIIAPIEDTPAYRGGILAGDRILKIENKSTRGMNVSDAIKMLRGAKGTPAVLTVMHENGDIKTLTIVRDMIRLETVKDVHFADEANKIGYIRLTQFQNNSTESLDKAVKELRDKGMKALIIDLRFNPGGMLSTAIEIADRFIDEGVIVSTKGRTQNEQVFRASARTTYPYFPVAVLVGNRSASASEILAGALQDHHRGVIVGMRTYGKGSVQTIIKLDDGKSAIRLTTAHYYTPSGKLIHHNQNDATQKEWGIEPDIIVPFTTQDEVDLWESWRERQVEAAKKIKPAGAPEDPLDDFEELRQQNKEVAEEKKAFKDAPLDAAINALKGAMLAENRHSSSPASAATK